MNRSILFAVALISISILLLGCLGPVTTDKDTGISVGKEITEKEDEKALSEKSQKVGKEEVPSTTTDNKWIIPHDEQLGAKFFVDLADVFARYRQSDMAQTLFEEAIDREKNNETKSAYYARLANIFFRARKPKLAAQAYENAFELTESDENKKEYYQSLGRIYNQLKLYDKGITVSRYMYEHEENDSRKPAAKRMMYVSYHRAGRLGEIIEPLKSKLDEDPDSIETLEELVLIHSNIERDPEKAISYLKKLTSISPVPDNRKYMNQLAGMYQQLNMHEEQIQVMLEIIEQVPEDQREAYILHTARIYTDADNAEKAIEFAEKALESNPDDMLNLFQVADIYKRNGYNEKADELFRKAMGLAKGNMQKQMILFRYAIANISQEDYEYAEKLFEEHEQLTDNNVSKIQLYKTVCREFSKCEQTDLAEKWIKKIMTLEPKNPDSYFEVANYYRKQERLENAANIINQGIDVVEETREKVRLLGRYSVDLNSLNDFDGARKALDRMRKLTNQKEMIEWIEEQEKKIEMREKELK